jgi:hypothetical protein
MLAMSFAACYCLVPLRRTRSFIFLGQALLIAAKIQEVHPPHAIELAELTLGACTARQIAEKELEMVQVRIEIDVLARLWCMDRSWEFSCTVCRLLHKPPLQCLLGCSRCGHCMICVVAIVIDGKSMVLACLA